MPLKIYSAKNFSTKLKVTIQGTGKLGFTAGTAKSIRLTPITYIKIACDSDDANILYLIVCNDIDEDGFKVDYISGYYSLPTTVLFNELGIDYKNYTVIYDLTREATLDTEANGTVYRMNKRVKEKKKKEAEM